MAERQQRRAARRPRTAPAPGDRLAIAQEVMVFAPTGQRVRRARRDGEWYYALDDLLASLPQREGSSAWDEAWDEAQARLAADGVSQFDARISEMTLTDANGVAQPTRVASATTALRLLEALAGPAAEAAREWLARVGAERLREEEDPAIAIERARKLYTRQGYSRDWTQRRLHGIILRQRLAQEWAARGAREGADYAALTDALSQGTFGLTVEAHKAAKGLRTSQSLRDSMTTMELLLLSLAEETALALSEARASQGIEALLRDARDASAISAITRRQIEGRIGRTLMTPANYRTLRQRPAPRHPRVYLGPPLPTAEQTRAATPPPPSEVRGGDATL